jgi:spoIIIJ-associated protein
MDAAIAEGLERLGVDRDEVEVEVLEEASRGVFGLGSRDARVRLVVKPSVMPAEVPVAPPVLSPDEPDASTVEGPEEEAFLARSVLEELLALLEMSEAKINVRRAEPAAGEKDPPLVLDVTAPTDELIGHRGETLAALQHITRLIIGREREGRVRVVVDVNGYKVRREQSLRRLALRLADQAVETDRTVVLEPMPPNERRIIHLELRDHPRVSTESIGEGDRRKVTIIPRYE